MGSRQTRRNGVGVTAPVLGDGLARYVTSGEVRGGVRSTFHAGLKNADLQTNVSAVASASRSYDAFGNVVGSSGTWRSPFGHAGPFGYQSDADTGFQLLGHRYYDPSTGRFLTRDPAKDGRNWYVYCGSSPVKRLDPTGLAFYDDPTHPIYNLLVGFGDGVTFGLTDRLRDHMGTNDMVDDDNLFYTGGKLGGQVAGTYMVGAGAGAAWSAARGGGAQRFALEVPEPGRVTT